MPSPSDERPSLHHPKLNSLLESNSKLFDYNENFIDKVNDDIKTLEAFLRSKAVTTEWTVNDWCRVWYNGELPNDLNLVEDEIMEVALWKEDEGERSPRLAWCRAELRENDFNNNSPHVYHVAELKHLSQAPIFVRMKLYKQLPVMLEKLVQKIADTTGYYDSQDFQDEIPF